MLLSAECGGIRPWEMPDFTPDETRQLDQYVRKLQAAREG